MTVNFVTGISTMAALRAFERILMLFYWSPYTGWSSIKNKVSGDMIEAVLISEGFRLAEPLRPTLEVLREKAVRE